MEYVDERVIMMRIKGRDKDLMIIQVYVATSQHSDEEVEECCDKRNRRLCSDSRRLECCDWRRKRRKDSRNL